MGPESIVIWIAESGGYGFSARNGDAARNGRPESSPPA